MSDEYDLEVTGYVKNPFVDESETEELADNSESMTETEAYYDEATGELKKREVESETEELEEQEEEKSEIEQLRSHYETMKRADRTSNSNGWSDSVDEARGNLIAALKERRSGVNDEIDDLRSYSSDDKEEELKSERQSINTEIEELRA